jgi:hypothetical protein
MNPPMNEPRPAEGGNIAAEDRRLSPQHLCDSERMSRLVARQ